MKILYAVQATGNGHISRAMELLPHLQQYGTVDIFLSGDNSNLALDAPVKYRSKGLSLYYNCTGGLSYWQTMKAFQLNRLKKEASELPVEKYDLVINDFEYITAAACAKKGVHSVNYGHQASFQSANTPRPKKKNKVGEWVLKNYARADRYIGLHFQPYDDFIFPPVIKKEVLQAEPVDKGYTTVYLPSLCQQQLKDLLLPYGNMFFEVFCREIQQKHRFKNILFLPVDKHRFNQSLIHCNGILTGAGFETPAEALQLGKKLMCIPIKGQYEQQCNAAALQQMGITCLSSLADGFEKKFEPWLHAKQTLQVDYSKGTEKSLSCLLNGAATPAVPFMPARTTGLLRFLV
jgi:uncharacterized protein (TIGR00661 family)